MKNQYLLPDFKKPSTSFVLFCWTILLCLGACKVPAPPKNIGIIVRKNNTDTLIPGAEINISQVKTILAITVADLKKYRVKITGNTLNDRIGLMNNNTPIWSISVDSLPYLNLVILDANRFQLKIKEKIVLDSKVLASKLLIDASQLNSNAKIQIIGENQTKVFQATNNELTAIRITFPSNTSKTIVKLTAKYNLNKKYGDNHTNALGAYQVPKRLWKDIKNKTSTNHYYITGNKEGFDTIGLRVNKYLPFYDLNLEELSGTKKTDTLITADMHYHVSMRVQNSFGNVLTGNFIPPNINWYNIYAKQKILYGGKWKNFNLKNKLFNRVLSTKQQEKGQLLLQRKWIRPRPFTHNNGLRHFSQATLPHMQQGKVYLAFNSISPFEYSISNDNGKRIVSSIFKSGANVKWLKQIGTPTELNKGKTKKKDRIYWPKFSHWENFNAEYKFIAAQERHYNNYDWRFYRQGTNLDDKIPTIINVVEGGHILQDRFFPHKVVFDLREMNRECEVNERIWKHIYNQLTEEERREWEKFEQQQEYKVSAPSLDSRDRRCIDEAKYLFVEKKLKEELVNNIRTLKTYDPPIYMMAVAHLTYNGMMGHAPSIDDGKALAKFLANKAYSIKVSDDKSYQKQWQGIFFSVPGPNEYGKTMMRELLKKNGLFNNRILIDLKHSDYNTRKFYYDSLMVQSSGSKLDTIPPIYSHGAATGLNSTFYSPFNDEYSIRKSPSTKTFYPFGINLYDEEITLICAHKGIIGLTLEQRALGGYVNTVLERYYPKKKKKDGTWIFKLQKENKWGKNRWEQIEALFEYFYDIRDQDIINLNLVERKKTKSFDTRKDFIFKDAFNAALNYTENTMGVPKDKVLEITYQDYISAEPFIQNLFYMLKHSKSSKADAWEHFCIGSDLDGLIDPIDICPTAGQYPHLRQRLKHFIPIFLKIQLINRIQFQAFEEGQYLKEFNKYFEDVRFEQAYVIKDGSKFTLDNALDYLFYKSLVDFSMNNFK